MIEEYEEGRKKQVNKMRSIMDYTMGIVFFVIGIYFLVYGRFGINFLNRPHSALDYIIGAVFVLYGAWRFYRGYRKNYFN